MKKIIEYTFEGKKELGIVGKATPLKDDLGNELKVGDVVFFQFEDDSKMFGISIVISTKENINYILGLYSLFDENGNKKENAYIEIIRSCKDIPSGAKHFIVNPIKTTIISYEDVEENAKISKAVHKILKNKKKGK